ncbi:hypothetical protein DL96DRAFT_1623156 [Flagelloscypha sp. PMI_526]|nr:hypothetical protein DL96DRAFT_1623156 [Flagelloscypha sp. PMI_526]
MPQVGEVLLGLSQSLTFLDLNWWEVINTSPVSSLSRYAINLSEMTPSHPFFLSKYPRLQCLRLTFDSTLDLPGMKETLRVEWFSLLFGLVTEPHPLKIMIFAPYTELSSQLSVLPPSLPSHELKVDGTGFPRTQISNWEKVDQALSNCQFSELQEVVVSLGEGQWETKKAFRRALQSVDATGRLGFRAVDFEEVYYTSRSK